MGFSGQASEVLEGYHQRMKAESKLMESLPIAEGMARRDEFLLPVGEVVGQFLNSLVVAHQSKTILEVGTSFGYSTLWLAQAAQKTGGKIITLEVDARKSAYAKEQIQKAGLSKVVDFVVVDAVEWITYTEERFDFVLLDIWKELYLPCLDAIRNKINPEGFLVADNMIHPPNHRNEAEAYRIRIKELERFDTILLPLGSGLEVSKKR